FTPFDVDLLVCRSASRIVTPKVPPPAIVTTAGTHRGIRTMDDEGKCYGIARAVARGRQAEPALAAGGPMCGWPASSAGGRHGIRSTTPGAGESESFPRRSCCLPGNR